MAICKGNEIIRNLIADRPPADQQPLQMYVTLDGKRSIVERKKPKHIAERLGKNPASVKRDVVASKSICKCTSACRP